MSVNRAWRVLCCYKLLLPLLYNGDPHTKAVRKPALLKPFFRENMYLVKDAGQTIKLISPGIFYKFNESLGSLHHTERYIHSVVFVKLIQCDIIRFTQIEPISVPSKLNRQ